MSAIGHDLVKKYKINTSSEYKSFYENLKYHLRASSISMETLLEKTKFKINKNGSKIPDFNKLEKIANFLNINLRDLIPPIKSKSVKIKKFNKNRSWFYPSKRNKTYEFFELTNLPELPMSKAYEFHVRTNRNHNDWLEVPCHQYIFNIGEAKCKINIKKNFYEILEPGDSIFLKPNLSHKFLGRSKLLILRIGGKISGDVLYQMSMISDYNIKRLVDDNLPWFNSK